MTKKEKTGDSSSGDSDDNEDYSKFNSNKLSKHNKEKRKKELEELKKDGKDVVVDVGGIRLPNRISKGLTIDPNTGTAKASNPRDVMASPTNFLRGAASPRVNSFASEQVDCI